MKNKRAPLLKNGLGDHTYHLQPQRTRVDYLNHWWSRGTHLNTRHYDNRLERGALLRWEGEGGRPQTDHV